MLKFLNEKQDGISKVFQSIVINSVHTVKCELAVFFGSCLSFRMNTWRLSQPALALN